MKLIKKKILSQKKTLQSLIDKCTPELQHFCFFSFTRHLLLLGLTLIIQPEYLTKRVESAASARAAPLPTYMGQEMQVIIIES